MLEKEEAHFIPILQVKNSDEKKEIRAWLKEHQPEVVIGRCDSFLEAAESENLKVPDDIGYVSLNINDDIEGVAGIRHRRDVIGSTAVDVLNGLLQRNFKGPLDVSAGSVIDGIWNNGESLH